MYQNSIKLMAATLVVAALAGCSKNDNPGPEDRHPVCFTGTVEGLAKVEETRAAGETWAGGDAIGIFMLDHGTSDINLGAANRKYTNTSGNSFVAAEGQSINYPSSGKVDFIAYYPYDAANTTLGTFNVDVAGIQTEASQAKIDVLYATADNGGAGYENSKTPVPLSFDHKLTRMEMNVSAGNGVSSLTGMTVKIEGLKTKNTFDLSDGSLGTANNPADITPRTIVTDKKYDAIVLPGAVVASDGVKVTFTVDGVNYCWKMENQTFVAGKQHIFQVTLSTGGVEVTGTIEPWETVDEDPVIAESE